MPLSCYCDDYMVDSSYYYMVAEELKPLPSLQELGRKKRAIYCKSCHKKLLQGDPVCELYRYRIDDNGNEIEQASYFWCESCWEIHENLTAAGYCIYENDCLPALLREYWALTNFNPERWKENHAINKR